jgi:hypothetical protein
LTPSGHPPVISATLTPVTAVVLAVVLAAGLWLAVAPPRWLAGDRLGRRFGVAVALVVAAGFVLVSRLGWHGVDGSDAGMMSYLLFVPPLTFVAGSATAAATGRSFRTGLTACAWATVLGGCWWSSPGWPRRPLVPAARRGRRERPSPPAAGPRARRSGLRTLTTAGQRLAKLQKAANAITLEDYQRRGWSYGQAQPWRRPTVAPAAISQVGLGCQRSRTARVAAARATVRGSTRAVRAS